MGQRAMPLLFFWAVLTGCSGSAGNGLDTEQRYYEFSRIVGEAEAELEALFQQVNGGTVAISIDPLIVEVDKINKGGLEGNAYYIGRTLGIKLDELKKILDGDNPPPDKVKEKLEEISYSLSELKIQH